MQIRPTLTAILLTLAMPLTAATTSVEDCLAIDSHLERLECYDSAARELRSQRLEADGRAVPQTPATRKTQASRPSTVPPAAPATAQRQTPTTTMETPASAPDDGAEKPGKPKRWWSPIFGRSEKTEQKRQEQTVVASRITDVRRELYGHHVVTLANGQTWVENEPGPREIEVNQAVTIEQKRLNFAMRLESGRVVFVHQVE